MGSYLGLDRKQHHVCFWQLWIAVRSLACCFILYVLASGHVAFDFRAALLLDKHCRHGKESSHYDYAMCRRSMPWWWNCHTAQSACFLERMFDDNRPLTLADQTALWGLVFYSCL